jgi:hypothetical protein
MLLSGAPLFRFVIAVSMNVSLRSSTSRLKIRGQMASLPASLSHFEPFEMQFNSPKINMKCNHVTALQKRGG